MDSSSAAVAEIECPGVRAAAWCCNRLASSGTAVEAAVDTAAGQTPETALAGEREKPG